MSTIIEMPKLSDTMTVGTVVKWYKEEGEEVSNGDILAEIETDKATMELENFDDGVLLKLLANEGDEVEIGKPLAVVGSPGEDVPEFDKPDNNRVAPVEDNKEVQNEEITLPKEEPDAQSTDLNIFGQTAQTTEQLDPSGRIFASPLAKKIAQEKNIDLSKIQGSGPRGRITKKDLPSLPEPGVKDTFVSGSTPPHQMQTVFTSSLQGKSIPVSNMRSIIAKRLLESKVTIPHFYLQKEINSEALRLTRESINRRLSNSSSEPNKISINDLILYACSRAIPLVPEINTSWADKEIIFHGEVNLAFGVAVDDGLVTPVIKKAEQLDLRSLSLEAKLLIQKSRNRKLTPDEMTGSTFTVTNLGMFGIDFFNGIINPPNAAILAIGASVAKPVLSRDGSVCAGETMTLGLSCDHRVVDGAIGAKFLQVLAEILENPASLLV